MPAQSHPRTRAGLGKSPRPALPEPGIGGYDYPRGPFGATGFPGSTPASPRTHTQSQDGRKDPSVAGVPELTISGQQAQWEALPPRTPGTGAASYVGGAPGVLIDSDMTAPRPKRPTGILGWFIASRQQQPPARIKARTTGPEHRMTPVIGGAPGSQNVRNHIAQRYKAVPGMVRAYRPAPNPGKTGAVLDGPSRYHPGTMVHGHPDGKPLPGMAPQPGYPPLVYVSSRYVSREGSQEGYAMNRRLLFTKGGLPADIPHGAAPHIRGARMSGLRYFGALADQQRIGLDSDAYGIVRKRGPRHRPVRFEQPTPHAANFYDEPSGASGSEAPDMIHRSPTWGVGRNRVDAASRTPGESRQTGRRPRRG